MGRRAAVGVLLSVCAISVGPLSAMTAAAATSPPPGLPGPPPGAGTALPALPGGAAPGTEPTGPPATIPSHVRGPALVTGVVRVRQSGLALAIACRTSGGVSLSVGAIRTGVLARGAYTCRNGRGAAQLQLRGSDARRLSQVGPALATVTLREGGATARASAVLQTSAQSPSYWTDGGLQCSFLGSNDAYLVAPDFTSTPPAVVDVRPWVAWYTAAGGWHWLGTAGINTSRWYRWTATASGLEQWKTPAGAVNPWTWAPIHVHPGMGTYAIGVLEVVYWYAHPVYTWRYTRSSLGGNALATYCSYP